MQKKNNRVLTVLIIIIFSMLCLAYASVPIYNLFCKATGYGGTVKRSFNFNIDSVSSKKIKVYFNSDVEKGLPWIFEPLQISTEIKIGQGALIFYKLKNNYPEQINGIAVYNVSPHKLGKYFNKVACFCFEKMTIEPFQEIILPVSFYLDKNMEKDPDTKDIKIMTLSYTFFEYN
ncbi:cytochrome c oxidase assembly protein [Anaplasmataceae bacterium AB001_6]|nr:cytochrome c oxidase assembly protein [Anaplasmataceae bacterium AB001_6]